jgi:TonB family protein
LKYLAQYFLLLVLFVGCTSFALAQDGKPQPKEIVTSRPSPEYFPESWKEFSSKEGRFTLLLPGVPVKNTQTLDSPYGKLEEHSFILKTFAYYGVAYIDFPEKDGIRDVKTFFAGFLEGNLKTTNAQLLEEKDDYRFATPGRFIKTRIEGGYINRIRLYLIRKRLYVLSVVMPEGDAETGKFYEEAAMKFLNSFKPVIPQPSLDPRDRFGKPLGDPVVRAPTLPTTGITVDPAIASKLPYSRDGKPEPKSKINSGILNGKALSLPKPHYPAEAKAAGAFGEVDVKVVIDESGNVIWAKTISGHELLQVVSEEAAYKAKFQPTTLKGEPVKVMGFLIYRFVAQ